MEYGIGLPQAVCTVSDENKTKKTLSGYVTCWQHLHLFHVGTYYFYTDF